MRFTRILVKPLKEKVIADSVITTTPIAFIFTRYCLFCCINYVKERKFVRKMYTEGALMSKSHNIVLSFVSVYIYIE